MSRTWSETPPRWFSVEEFHAMRKTIFYPKTDLDAPDETLQALKRRTADELGITAARVAQAGMMCFGVAPAVEPLVEQGTFHRLFRLRLPDGKTFILRANAAHELYRDYLMLQDAWLAPRLRDVGAPALHAVDLSRDFFPFDYEIIDDAEGVSLTSFDERPEIVAKLRLLGATAARIHQTRLAGFGYLDVRPLAAAGDTARAATRGIFGNWRDYVELNLERHGDACVKIGATTADERRRILQLFAAHTALFDAAPSALLHGDLGNHNVFTDGERITAIIDWEDCLLGDPAFDVAFWATFHPEPRHAAFLEGYQRIVELPADFWLRFWLYFLRVSLAKTVHRHRFRYVDRPGRPPAARRIQLSLERLESLLHNVDWSDSVTEG